MLVLVTMQIIAKFELTTFDLYFTILIGIFMTHILAENTYFKNHTEWTEYKILVLKPGNKYIPNYSMS